MKAFRGAVAICLFGAGSVAGAGLVIGLDGRLASAILFALAIFTAGVGIGFFASLFRTMR